MKTTYTFEGVISDSVWEDLKKIESKDIVLVERKNGFTQIYTENGIEYTTSDILEKELVKINELK